MIRYNPPVLGVDISKWQRVVGGDYEFPVFCARVHSGYGVDRNFAANARVVAAIPGVKVRSAYIVPVQGMDRARAVRDVMAVLPAGWCVMIDEESGAGFQGPGNHSAVNNDLRERFIKALGGNRRAVWGYANGGDWASGWPDRGDTPMVVAKYSANDNDLIRSAQCIGWQYSDGNAQWGVPSGYPRGSRAVGNCDMNVYGFASGDAFAAWIGGAHSVASDNDTQIEGDDVDVNQLRAELNADRLADRADMLEQTNKAIQPALAAIAAETQALQSLRKDFGDLVNGLKTSGALPRTAAAPAVSAAPNQGGTFGKSSD